MLTVAMAMSYVQIVVSLNLNGESTILFSESTQFSRIADSIVICLPDSTNIFLSIPGSMVWYVLIHSASLARFISLTQLLIPPICLSVYPLIHLPTYSPIRPPAYTPIRPPVYPPLHLSTHSSICLSTFLSTTQRHSILRSRHRPPSNERPDIQLAVRPILLPTYSYFTRTLMSLSACFSWVYYLLVISAPPPSRSSSHSSGRLATTRLSGAQLTTNIDV